MLQAVSHAAGCYSCCRLLLMLQATSVGFYSDCEKLLSDDKTPLSMSHALSLPSMLFCSTVEPSDICVTNCVLCCKAQ